MGERHADGVARGRVPAGLDHRSEAADPAVSGGATHQELAAPDGAVVAQTEAVEREPEHLAAQPVLGHRRGDVRVVMLHGDGRHAERGREPRRHEVRVPVVRHDLGLDPEDQPESVERLAVGAHRLLGVEVPDVLGEERLATVRETEGAVEEGAGSERRRGVDREVDRTGSRRPCAPQDARRHVTRPHPHDAVVVPRHDLPVVDEHRVGDRGETLGGVLVRDADRLIAGVPAGHHERTIHRPQQQMVERRGGQHHPVPDESGRHRRRQRARPRSSALSAPARTRARRARAGSGRTTGGPRRHRAP